VNELIRVYDRYISELLAELNETVPFASIHGWRSNRYEIGVECRAAIKASKAKMRRATHNKRKPKRSTASAVR